LKKAVAAFTKAGKELGVVWQRSLVAGDNTGNGI
jgi:hypothetical protein